MYDQTAMRAAVYHLSMLQDTTRVAQFQQALAAVVRPGAVVLDVGSGTGLLAFLALQCGAARAYAVELGPVIALAQEIARANGLAERIVWLHEKSTQVNLPEPVDVVVSETIGNFGLDEGIVTWMEDAARRHLKPGGRVIPQALTLWAAPLETAEGHRRIAPWNAPVCGLDYTPAHQLAANMLHYLPFGPEALLASPQPWATVTLPAASSPHTITGSLSFVCSRGGTLHGLGGWFQADLGAGITLSNGPEASTTSWARAFMPLAAPIAVERGDQVVVRLAAHANGSLWRWQVRCSRPTPEGTVLLAACDHDTLRGQLLSSQMLRLRRADNTPTLSPAGEVMRFVLAQMDGQTTQGEIAHRLAERFPQRFARWEEALDRVGDVATHFAAPAA